MPIELDRASSEPLYRQVATSVRRAIDDGLLRPGQRVPSVRVLADQLGVGRLTIATAYEQLAAEGYLVGRMGFGTIVAPEPPTPAVHEAPFGPRPAAPRVEPVRLPALRSVPAKDMAGTEPPSRRPLHALPRFDLRSSAAAGWSGSGAGSSDGGLAVGGTLERLLRRRVPSGRRAGRRRRDPGSGR